MMDNGVGDGVVAAKVAVAVAGANYHCGCTQTNDLDERDTSDGRESGNRLVADDHYHDRGNRAPGDYG